MMCVLSCWLLIKWHCILDWLWLSDANSSVPAGVFLTRDSCVISACTWSWFLTSCRCWSLVVIVQWSPTLTLCHSHHCALSALMLATYVQQLTSCQFDVLQEINKKNVSCCTKAVMCCCRCSWPCVCMLIVLRLTVNQSLQCCVQMPRQYSVCLDQSILQLHFIMMTAAVQHSLLVSRH